MKLYKYFNAENIRCLQNNKESMRIWDQCYWYLLFSFCNAAFNYSAVNWNGWLSSLVTYRKKNISKNKKIEFSKRELMLHNLCGKYILQCLRGNICKPNLLVVWQTESWQMSVQNSACTEWVQSYTSYDTPLVPLCSLRKWWAVSKSTVQVPSLPLASGCNVRVFLLFSVNLS